MAITFDYTNSLIGVPQANAQPLDIQALTNAIRQQEASVQGITFPSICTAAGKDSLGGAVQVGITLTLLNSWRLSFTTGAYQATITGGNLSDALNKVLNTGSPQVLVLSSAAATVVDGSGNSSNTGNFPTVAEIAAGVWDEILESTLTARQIQLLIGAAVTGNAVRVNGVWKFRDTDGLREEIFASSDNIDRGISASSITDSPTLVSVDPPKVSGKERVIVRTKKLP